MANNEIPPGWKSYDFASTDKGLTLISVNQMERTVKGYGITESELDQIGYFNTLSTVFFSAFSTLILFGIGIEIDCFTANPSTPNTNILSILVAPLCFGLALLFLSLGVYTNVKKDSTIARIKRDSKPLFK